MLTTPRAASLAAALAALLPLLPACADDEPDCGEVALEDATEPPDVALAAGMSVLVAVRAADGCGPAAGVGVTFEIPRGGGTVTPASATTGADGRVAATWVLGPAPVRQELRASAASLAPPGDAVDWWVNAVPNPSLAMPPFGEVEAFLAAEGAGDSTEDLAFVGEGAAARLVMGAPGGLLEVAPDGAVTRRQLSGEPVGRIWGLAAGPEGAIWGIAAAAKTLVHIAANGVVTTRLADDGAQPFDGPNYVAVGPDGHVYVTDPCLGEIVRFDPVADAVLAVEPFDLATEGGPNGLAFGPDGRLYGLTENTAVLCNQLDVAEPEAPLAQLFAVALTGTGFGAREALATGLGVFGDGLAFDAEDNLYLVVDTVKDFALEASLVLVRPADGGPPARLFDASPDVIANVAFGRGAYGETTLYAALLQIPLLTPGAQRGLRAVDLRIPGRPLPW